MYTKDEITFGYVNLSDVVRDSKSSPVVAVAKTLEINPQMLMWDPAQLTIDKPEDIAASGAKVLHFDKTTYIDWMITKGYIKSSQSDPTYGGAPDTWVANSGNFIQQGFVSNEIYQYENTIDWKDGKPAPVKYLLIDSIGFRDYPAAMTVRKDKLEALSPCLALARAQAGPGLGRLPRGPRRRSTPSWSRSPTRLRHLLEGDTPS